MIQGVGAGHLPEWIERLAVIARLPEGVVAVLLLMYAGLGAGTLVRAVHLRGKRDEGARSLRVRVRTWWMIAIVLTLALLLGPPAIVIVLALASVLGLREFINLAPVRAADAHVVFWLYVSVPVNYAIIALGWHELWVVFVPVFVAIFMLTRMTLVGETTGFADAGGHMALGMLLTVYLFSHSAALLALPGDGIGLFVYLVLLTEANDIAQAIWGRALGRRRAMPRVSPGKTIEGLLGGVSTTVVLAVALAPLLTRFGGPSEVTPALFPFQHAVAAGLLIGVAGFAGDVTISALKRDRGVKDSGQLLPGQGGMLDRIDSLLFTAPLFYHYVRFLSA